MGAELFHADRRIDMTKPIVRFRNFANAPKKQDAWEELAKEMNRHVDECKKKMENLLSALRREKMQIRKSNGTGRVKYFQLNC